VECGSGSSWNEEDTVGLCTISPHSSSSSLSFAGTSANWVIVVKPSGMLGLAQGSALLVDGLDARGEIKFVAMVVSCVGCNADAVRLCSACSDLRGVKSTDTARPSCLCTFVTAGCLSVVGVKGECESGLLGVQGSEDSDADGELQSKAALAVVDRAGRLCLTGAAVTGLGAADVVREWLCCHSDWTGAGESQ
jgi:hypothetical protein